MCCGDSQFRIINQSGQTVTISLGFITGLLHFDKLSIRDNDAFNALAYPGEVTRGGAGGYVNVEIGNTGLSLKLDYKFTPKNISGDCPCVASATPQSSMTGPYSAAATTSDCVNNVDRASVVWKIDVLPRRS